MGPDRAEQLRSFIKGWCENNNLVCHVTHSVLGRQDFSIMNQSHTKGVELMFRYRDDSVHAFVADQKYPHGGKDMGQVSSVIPLLKEVFHGV